MIKSGRMRVIMTIQKNTKQRNALNQLVDDWVNLYTDIRAQEIKRSGGERSGNSGEIDRQLCLFRLRYMPNINTDCRILINGKILDIDDVENVGSRNRELIVNCIHVSRQSTVGI